MSWGDTPVVFSYHIWCDVPISTNRPLTVPDHIRSWSHHQSHLTWPWILVEPTQCPFRDIQQCCPNSHTLDERYGNIYGVLLGLWCTSWANAMADGCANNASAVANAMPMVNPNGKVLDTDGGVNSTFLPLPLAILVPMLCLCPIWMQLIYTDLVKGNWSQHAVYSLAYGTPLPWPMLCPWPIPMQNVNCTPLMNVHWSQYNNSLVGVQACHKN